MARLLIVDDEMNINLKNSVNKLSASMDNIAILSQDLRDMVGNEKDIIPNIVANIDNTAANLSNISDSISVINYQTIISSLQTTVDNLNVITNALKNGHGSAGLLLIDDSLYRNLNNTINNVNSLIGNIEENPKKYIKISVF